MDEISGGSVVDLITTLAIKDCSSPIEGCRQISEEDQVMVVSRSDSAVVNLVAISIAESICYLGFVVSYLISVDYGTKDSPVDVGVRVVVSGVDRVFMIDSYVFIHDENC